MVPKKSSLISQGKDLNSHRRGTRVKSGAILKLESRPEASLSYLMPSVHPTIHLEYTHVQTHTGVNVHTYAQIQICK